MDVQSMPFPEQGNQKNPLIRLQGCSKRFGKHAVLNDVSLDIQEGEIIGIIGLSGSGKTTLLNMLVGLLTPDDGDILYRENKGHSYYSVSRIRHDLTKLTGFAPQDPSFYRRLTVRENLDHFACLYKIHKEERKRRIASLLKLVDLQDAGNTLGRDLSGGMQRRFGISCSLVHNPPILVLDEVTSDLDPVLRKDIWNLIREVHSQGRTIIMTSHFHDELDYLCDKVAILHEGTIKAFGTPSELKEGLTKDFRVSLQLASGNHEGALKALRKSKFGVSEVHDAQKQLHFSSPDGEKVVPWLLDYLRKNKEEVIDIHYGRPSLNEVFECIVEESGKGTAPSSGKQ